VAPKRRSAEAARNEIRKTALDLFVAHGYGATSLEDIAGRLRLTRQAVLYHFRTKEELLRNVLDPYFSEIASVVDGIHVSDPPSRAERRAAIAALVEVSVKHRRAIALLNRFTTESKIADLGPLLVTLKAQFVRLLAVVDDRRLPLEDLGTEAVLRMEVRKREQQRPVCQRPGLLEHTGPVSRAHSSVDDQRSAFADDDPDIRDERDAPVRDDVDAGCNLFGSGIRDDGGRWCLCRCAVGHLCLLVVV
jgi:AcrR family transcriptional regulator